MPNAGFRSVKFDEVDWHDAFCLITYGPDSHKLYVSINSVGLLQTPLLQQQEDGLLKIICGSRRMAVCKELGLEPITCQVLSVAVPLETCLRMAIYDNIAVRVLNPVEKMLALTKMAEHVEQSVLVGEMMPLLDLEPSVKLLKRYIELKQLETVILDSLASGKLDERIGFALTPLEQEDRLSFFQLFQELPFSVSLQKEMVEMVEDIALRTRVTPAEVIDAKEIREFREDHSRPARQRALDIRRHLQALRSPRLTARQARFDEEIRELGLPAGVRLVPPPHFEGPRWSVECSFKRTDELAACLRQVARLADKPTFQRLMVSKR